MKQIDANGLHYQALNETIRQSGAQQIVIENCLGHRYIAAGLSGSHITIHGVPGNALGAYLNGAEITVSGNAQDATGDTMNDGCIVVHGSCGDTTGYAMRGGAIYIERDAGYRAGIHMKAYQQKLPVLVIGGCAGSFLGEYQAGGLIIVLGLDREKQQPLVGNFCAAGMHGGLIVLRGSAPADLSPQVLSRPANQEDLAKLRPYLATFCTQFGKDLSNILSGPFTVLTPDTKNPYKQLYTHH